MEITEGMRFGKWTVLIPLVRGMRGMAHATVKCDCGTIRDVRHSLLKSGESKSCGCARREHGLFAEPVYQEWRKAVKRAAALRCGQIIVPKGKSIRNLRIDPTWKASFKAFREYAGLSGYRQGLQLKRIDKRRGFFPENCRWVEPNFDDLLA